MKSIYILSITLFLFTPMKSKAESYWLIIQNSSYGIEKIEMKNMEQCNVQGKEYSKSSGIPRYLCLKGK